MKTLYLLFSHKLTAEQQADARQSLGVEDFVALPDDLQRLFSNVPPDTDRLKPYLKPLRKWLKDNARPGDPVLIQGDFGATYQLVRFAKKQGLLPLYATTSRQSVDEPQPDGSVVTKRTFKHCRFRKY